MSAVPDWTPCYTAEGRSPPIDFGKCRAVDEPRVRIGCRHTLSWLQGFHKRRAKARVGGGGGVVIGMHGRSTTTVDGASLAVTDPKQGAGNHRIMHGCGVSELCARTDHLHVLSVGP